MENHPTFTELGRYQTLKTIGKGGMGEVLLAYDPLLERQIAIKKIRSDLKSHLSIKNRFLREAKLTARLTHPGIMSIYDIHQDEGELYYTMPYIPGKTLRQILLPTPQKKDAFSFYDSIPSLLPIFRNICMTISYSHSRGILHRDLKPENVLVGTFGEVIVFDWGLAQEITEPPSELEEVSENSTSSEITSPGKLVGTVAFMAPERALGEPANFQTDIYAIGVILYQILTLHLPFKRTTIKELRKQYPFERLQDPEEVAPYRDVPPRLSRMVRKCLEPDPNKRYRTMDELIHDLEGHMEGRSEWFEAAALNIQKKRHWEFQENVLLSKHIAITRSTEEAEWVSMMVSKSAFAENTRIETRVKLGEGCAGIGFLLCVPEAQERENPLEGYCLWLGSELRPGFQLFRNTVQVMQHQEQFLKRFQWHTLMIEKVGNHIHFYLDGIQKLSYLSYLPLFGTHVGMLARDADFEVDTLKVSMGSQNLQVSCLTIPDAFLASKDYKRALAEYRRIGYSFPGHAEGREALFRAGITLMEQAKASRKEKTKEDLYTLALEEFAKLHRTPGAPLEYLGKALVYQSLRDHPEEVKCLELGLRRYMHHPLVSVLKEQVMYRMHEAAQTNRRSAYQLILIALRLLPEIVQGNDFQMLLKDLVANWEPLPFLESTVDPSLLGKEKSHELRFAIPIAFWLGAPYILLEIFEELLTRKPFDTAAIGDILFSLFELGSYGLASKLMAQAADLKPSLLLEEAQELDAHLRALRPLELCHNKSYDEAVSAFLSLASGEMNLPLFRTLTYLLQYALKHQLEKKVETMLIPFFSKTLSKEERITLDALRIWAFLKQSQWKEAGEIFEKYPYELLNQEGTILHPLFGCYLYATEGEEIALIHLAGVIDTPFPRSWALLGHELTNQITDSPAWYNASFLWERRHLNQQLCLYYQIAKNTELEAYYRFLEREEYIYVPE